MKKIIFILILLLLTAGTLYAGEEDLSGKDFVEMGELQLLSGTLLYQDDEWYLNSEGDIYEIHLGDHSYRENIDFNFKDNEEAVVCGFKYNNDIAVVFMAKKENSCQLRTIEGKPLWAGQGKANNEDTKIEEEWAVESFGE